MTEGSPERMGADNTRRIGRYELLSGLHVGGMAELYLAATLVPGGFRRFVALKKILPEVQEDPQFVRMFLDEARLTAALSHSNIAQVYDLGSDEGELYLAMELILGLDLARILKGCRRAGKPLPVGLACMAARDICLALHHAHHFVNSAGQPSPIIHRDITPTNLMITFDGRVKVIDFGLALGRGRLESTMKGVIKGTLSYMSPEQVLSKPLDGRSDQFSLGVVLHELLSGQRLFTGNSPVEIIMRVLEGPVPSPREINPEVPPAVAEVVLRALSPERDRRYGTAREMAQALEAATGGAMFTPDAAATFMWETFPSRIAEYRGFLSMASGGPEASGISGEGGGRGTYRQQPPLAALRARAGRADPPQAVEESRPRRLSILTVDDESANLLVMKRALEALGFLVVGFSSARRALDQIELEWPDLILLDVEMPEMDGFELCRRIRGRSLQRQNPILFLSGSCSLEERVLGMLAGGDDFLPKPIVPEELAARVQDHLQRWAMLLELLAPGASAPNNTRGAPG